MKYLKLFILLYTCVQLSYCNAKNNAAQKADDGNTSIADQKNSKELSTGGPLNKSAFVKAIASLKNGELLDTVSLKNILPPSLLYLTRVSFMGRQVNQSGKMFSTSEANYRTNGKLLYVSITDVGTDSIYLKTLAPWSNMQFQNTRGDGYEKSMIVDGNKIDEKYNSPSNTANLTVIYNGRILVDLLGTNCNVDELYSIIK